MKKMLWIWLLTSTSAQVFASKHEPKESAATLEAALILQAENKPERRDSPIPLASQEVLEESLYEESDEETPLVKTSPPLSPTPTTISTAPEVAVSACSSCAAKYAAMARYSKITGPLSLGFKAIVPIFGWEWVLLEYWGRQEVKETLAGAIKPCYIGLDTIASHGVLPAKNYQLVADILTEASAAVSSNKQLSQSKVLGSFYNDFLKRGYPETSIDFHTMVAYLDAVNHTAIARGRCRYLYSREHLIGILFKDGVLQLDCITVLQVELDVIASQLRSRESVLDLE